jgi:endo-1,4-beta-D-glucanase Y
LACAGDRSAGRQPIYSAIAIEAWLRTDHAPANFATIKHMAHNLIRNARGKASLRLKRKSAGWDDDFLASLLTP